MKTSSILIVRRPGAKTGSINWPDTPVDSFFLYSGIEILFFDIKRPGNFDISEKNSLGIAIKWQVLHKKAESLDSALEESLKTVIQDHEPGIALILSQGDDRSQWSKKAAYIITDTLPGVPIYRGTPCPGAATFFHLGAANDEKDLAEQLVSRAGQSQSGNFVFLIEPDGLEKVMDILAPWMNLKSPSDQFCLQIPVCPDMDFSSIEHDLQVLVQNGLAMMHWEVKGPASDLPRELLWKVSNQGVWNHVSGANLFDFNRPDSSWIANTPTIVHSFEDKGAVTLDAGVTPPEALLTYGKLPALPGRPIWQILGDPGLLLPCLDQISKRQLLRMRVDEKTGAVYRLGNQIEYFFKAPHEICGELMEEIITMVDAGGSVDITHVRANLEKAYLIGYAMENGRVAGNSSLKHPRQIFIDRLRSMTGLDFTRCVERGYTSVRPEYRAMGIGVKLLEGLTQRAVDVKVFSIISEDNLATQKIAIRNNTRRITTYFSEKLGKNMGVWMPEHMISGEWDPARQKSGKGESDT